MSLIGTQTEHIRLSSPLRLDPGQSTPSSRASSPPQSQRTFARNATIVLVGARGSGKRSLGFIGATHLGRRLITEDHYFEEVTGLSRKVFLSRYGNKEFCRRNVEVLQRMLADNPSNCIIECGMGSLARDAQVALREYSKTHPVIYVLRNPARTRQLLKLSETESRRLEHADSIHRSCSNFEYYNLHDPSCENQSAETTQDRGSPNYSFGLKDAKQDFSNFLDIVTGHGIDLSVFESPFSLAAMPAERRPYTHALSVRLSDLLRRDVDLVEVESAGGTVVELRIDVWVSNMLSVIDKQVATIRRRIGVPIIFNIEESLLLETSSTVPKTPGESLTHFQTLGKVGSKEEEAAITLSHHSLRLGIEYLTVNLELREDRLQELLRDRGSTKIIGQYIDKNPSPMGWLDPSRLAMYRKANWLRCDIVRLLQVASSTKDNDDVLWFSDSIAALPMPRPLLIAYNLGALGHASLIKNKIFTRVTHPAIQRKSKSRKPEEYLVTAHAAMQALYQTSVVDPLHFYIVGATVSYSLSPLMHNAAYRVCGMAHHFQIRQASSLDDLQRLALDPHFGGAGISQPFKVGIMAHLQAHSHHARAVGAVNTLLPLRAVPDGNPNFLYEQANLRNHAGTICGWYGDNTDWIGIMTCLRRSASPRNVVQPSKTTGLVIGAGGMARAAIYAMIQLGCRRIFIFNRTVENAENVAAHFNSWAGPLSDRGQIVTVLKSRDEPWPSDCRPPTLMVSCVPAHSVFSRPAANFEMPLQWLGSPSGGVIMEMAYKPKDTPLLRQIRQLRQETGQAWVTVDFLEVLPEQGIAQFELMTGRKAPRGVMRSEVSQAYQSHEFGSIEV